MLPEKAPTTPSPDWTAPKRFGWYVLECDYLSMTNHANKHDLVYPPKAGDDRLSISLLLQCWISVRQKNTKATKAS